MIQTDQAKFYKFRALAEQDRQAGDRTVWVPAATLTPKVGATLQMLGASWRVQAVVPDADAFALHVRLS